MKYKECLNEYPAILLESLDTIINRFDPDYGFIDTKIDIFTGEDLHKMFGNIDLFGRETIYSWIQSRGIEALCGHLKWIEQLPNISDIQKKQYRNQISSIVKTVIIKLEDIRAQGNGSLFFWFDKEGTPFILNSDGKRHPLPEQPSDAMTFSDMFHVKALATAAELLQDSDMTTESRAYFSKWINAVENNKAVSDQQPFDPRNPVTPTPNRFSHGAYMITLGSFAIFADIHNDQTYIEGGLRFIQHILNNHVNINNRFPTLSPLDFVEFIDAGGNPYMHEGKIICDPGHAVEFVGLAFKFINTIRNRTTLTPHQRTQIENCDKILPQILLHAFEVGHNPIGGIYKSIDLLTRKPYNSDMPWWNLPEAMRAAHFAGKTTTDTKIRNQCSQILQTCSEDFLRFYVRPEIHSMAYQTLNQKGIPIHTVPATPDLDPGYHTGLSIIDILKTCQL